MQPIIINTRRAQQEVESYIFSMYGITSYQIHSRDRRQTPVKARFLAFYLLKVKYGMNYSEIGKLYNRDHTTVINGIRKVENTTLLEEAKKLLSTYPQR